MCELVNVVGGGDLNREVRLDQLYNDLTAPTVRYNPESFSALYVKFQDSGPAVMVFSSGKYNIAGAKSVESLKSASDFLLNNLSGLGIEINQSDVEVEVRNRVYVDDCGFELDLEILLPDLGFENTEYEPEIFPGIMYRPSSGGLLIIFRSGKVMVTGLSDPQRSKNTIRRVKTRISELIE